MSDQPSSDDPTNADMAPGDEAPPGIPGTGEDVCPVCGGSGRADGAECRECAGTGRVVREVGGG
jgi:hypothetical protein